MATPTPEVKTYEAYRVSVSEFVTFRQQGFLTVRGLVPADDVQELNEHMDRECECSQARYGIRLDASLITGIDPPAEVESALAAINTAYNQVSSDISLAQAAADQKIVQSKRAVEIETLKAEAEVEPLKALASIRT